MSRLLLIDDEADVQYSFQRIFDSPEVELTTASSGEEGLKLIPKLKPDLVVMDVRMGGITGMETLRRIRQIDSKLLIILMTALPVQAQATLPPEALCSTLLKAVEFA